jgi:hypothetical protein
VFLRVPQIRAVLSRAGFNLPARVHRTEYGAYSLAPVVHLQVERANPRALVAKAQKCKPNWIVANRLTRGQSISCAAPQYCAHPARATSFSASFMSATGSSP